MAERRLETGRFDGITEFSELTELGRVKRQGNFGQD
jgi:hypothetical protein